MGALGALGSECTLTHKVEPRAKRTPILCERGREARASVRVTHMELDRGQAKGHPACTCRSGPLPASLASATRPLLRGTADWLAVWLAAHSLGRGGQAGPRLGTPSLVARRRRVRWFMCACSPHATDDDRSTQQQHNSQQPGRRKRGGPPKKRR